MTFLQPAFFFGLVALIIPIIIHLFDFRKTKKIYFSSTHLLHAVKESSNSLLKLKHWLILLSRLLFILFLVLAFSQPFIPSNKKAFNGNKVAVYLDNSQSLTINNTAETNGIDIAKELTVKIMEYFPEETKFKVLTSDFSYSSNYYKRAEPAKKLVQEIKAGYSSRNLEDALHHITDDSQNLPNEIFIVSDFQKNTSMDLASLLADTLATYYLLPVLNNDVPNISVDSIYLENPYALNRENIKLNVIVRNFYNESRDNIPLRVILNGKQVASSTVSFETAGVEILTFELGYDLQEQNEGHVEIDDLPSYFDNTLYFSLNLNDRISVVEIMSGESNRAMENVYGNKELFNFDRLSVNNIDYSIAEAADLLVLNGIEKISTAISTKLLQYSSEGKVIVIIPNEKTDLSSFTLFTGMSLSISKDDQPISLSTPDFGHPFFNNIIQNEHDRFIMPTATPVWSWGNDRSALLKFEDGRPYLSTVEKQKNVYVFASPLTDTMGNVQNHALFVPVMYKIAASSISQRNQLYYRLENNIIDLELDSLVNNELVKLSSAQVEIIPQQRSQGKSINLDIPKPMLVPNNYNVLVGNKSRSSISYNLEKKESDLACWSKAELEILASNHSHINLFDTESTMEFGQHLKNNYEGTSLWKYALCLSLVFLLAEVLIIRFL